MALTMLPASPVSRVNRCGVWVKTSTGVVAGSVRVGLVERWLFPVVLLLCVAIDRLSNEPASGGWFVVALVLLLVSGLSILLDRRDQRASLLVGGRAMSILLAVLLLREAAGGSRSGWGVLVLLPVLMLSMYGTVRQLIAGIAVMSVGLLLPVALVGAPRYPTSSVVPAVRIVAFAVLNAFVVGRFRRALIDHSERSAATADALRLVEQSLNESLHAMPHPVARFEPIRDERGSIIDLDCRFINVAAVEELGKWTDERSLTMQLKALFDTKISEQWHQVIDTGLPVSYELVYDGGGTGGAGPWRLLEVQLVRVGTGILATWRDVTRAKLEVESLQDAERHWRGLAEIVVDATIEVDLDGTVLAASESIAVLFGVEAAAAIGTSVYAEVHPGDIDKVRAGLANARVAPVPLEFRLFPLEGQPNRWLEAYARSSTNNAGAISVAIRDVTTRRNETDALEHRALHDPLTGVFNRAGFVEVANAMLHMTDRGAAFVVFIDLDGFKAVNDQFGHGVGDEVLRVVAGRLKLAMRESDALARLGGDEFAIVGRTTKPAEIANEMVQRLEQILGVEIPIEGGRTVTIGASIGVALSDVGTTMNQLIDAADRHMYSNKRISKSMTPSTRG